MFAPSLDPSRPGDPPRPPAPGSEAALAKHRLRERVRAERRARSGSERAAASAGIADVLDALSAGCTVVACFLATATEPDTLPFLRRAVHRGLRVLLPISRSDGRLDWAAWTGEEDALTSGAFGIREPSGPALGPDALAEAELVIVPAAAVDRTGVRLGWGRGYYDRALAGLPVDAPVYAVVYDSEVVDIVPREPHDRPVTGVITPTGALTLRPPHL